MFLKRAIFFAVKHGFKESRFIQEYEIRYYRQGLHPAGRKAPDVVYSGLQKMARLVRSKNKFHNIYQAVLPISFIQETKRKLSE